MLETIKTTSQLTQFLLEMGYRNISYHHKHSQMWAEVDSLYLPGKRIRLYFYHLIPSEGIVCYT